MQANVFTSLLTSEFALHFLPTIKLTFVLCFFFFKHRFLPEGCVWLVLIQEDQLLESKPTIHLGRSKVCAVLEARLSVPVS